MIREAKEANVREKRKLSLKIEGYGGINANYRFVFYYMVQNLRTYFMVFNN